MKKNDIDEELLSIDFFSLSNEPKEPLTREYYEKKIKFNSRNIKYAPEEFLTKELCEYAIKDDSTNIIYIPEKFLTMEMCVYAYIVNPDNIRYIPDKFLTEELYEYVNKYKSIKKNMLKYVKPQSITVIENNKLVKTKCIITNTKPYIKISEKDYKIDAIYDRNKNEIKDLNKMEKGFFIDFHFKNLNKDFIRKSLTDFFQRKLWIDKNMIITFKVKDSSGFLKMGIVDIVVIPLSEYLLKKWKTKAIDYFYIYIDEMFNKDYLNFQIKEYRKFLRKIKTESSYGLNISKNDSNIVLIVDRLFNSLLINKFDIDENGKHNDQTKLIDESSLKDFNANSPDDLASQIIRDLIPKWYKT